MTVRPPRRKSRRSYRSSTGPSRNTLSSPATPFVPITNPTVRSEPPRSRTCSGSRKNDANVRKKQKFATATRANAGDTSGVSDLPLTRPQYTWARDGIRTSARGQTAAQAAQGAREGARSRAREGSPQGTRHPQRREVSLECPEPEVRHKISGGLTGSRCVAPPRNSFGYYSSSRLAGARDPTRSFATNFRFGTLEPPHGCRAQPVVGDDLERRLVLVDWELDRALDGERGAPREEQAGPEEEVRHGGVIEPRARLMVFPLGLTADLRLERER